MIFKMRFLFGPVLLASVCLLASDLLASDPDASRTFSELIASRNLTLQTHEVVTEDGYIIVIHRVVPRTFNATIYSRQRKPVIAFHGLMCDSSFFFINSPCLSASAPDCKDNFGLRLAHDNSAYDLWVPNARGNGESTGHISPNPSFFIQDYWKFSFEQMGKYDLPAVIDYVLNQTGHKTVGYVGYSQGGGSALAMATMKPSYANKLKPFIGWASGVYLQGATTILNPAVQVIRPGLELVAGKFVLTEDWVSILASRFCTPAIIGQPAGLCNAALEAAVGLTNSVNISRIPVLLNFFPALVSNWQMAHFAQQFAWGKFAHYDYGLIGNLKVYNAPTAPSFDLSKIPKNFTTILMYGTSDNLITPENSIKVATNLRAQGLTTVIDLRISNPDPAHPTDASKAKWNHLDFVAGVGAGALVYDKTINYLNQFIEWDGPPKMVQ